MTTNWRNEVDPEAYAAAQRACPMGHNGELYAPCDDCLRKAVAEYAPPWESRWLDFVEVHDTGKTKVWDVLNRESGFYLGQVKWYGGFRKYAYYPEIGTLYDAACLADVAHFMQLRMNERKKTRGKA